MENQLIELQEMLAHAQADITKMSAEMYAQQREITELKVQVKRLGEQVEQGQADEGEGGGYEPPPPHY